MHLVKVIPPVSENFQQLIGFIKVLLDNELDEDEKLKSDYSILMEYKQAELNCENVFKVKEVISKIK